jgi:uncharacterized protein (DUF1330 family)
MSRMRSSHLSYAPGTFKLYRNAEAGSNKIRGLDDITGGMMAAYIIVDMTVTDPVGIEQYRKLAGASVATHGGSFLVRGGKVAVLDGDWKPQRIVVIEFPTAEQAKNWWSSPDYRAACVIRDRAAKTRMLLVEGIG